MPAVWRLKVDKKYADLNSVFMFKLQTKFFISAIYLLYKGEPSNNKNTCSFLQRTYYS